MAFGVMNVGLLQQELAGWFQQNQRPLPWRQTRDPYAIWVSEVMLQQTQVVKVLDYYDRFLTRFPDVFALAEADLQDVLKQWEGMGYYSRARHLHEAAKHVVSKWQGHIPADYDAFRSLPGVGEYIAAAVMSQAFALPYPSIDGNIKRVLARLFLLEKPINHASSWPELRHAMQQLFEATRPGQFNQALMELGATICRPQNPRCHDHDARFGPAGCPLASFCRACQENRVSEFPVKIKKKPIPEYDYVAAVICKKARVLIIRRQNKGLLGGLWEFPNARVSTAESNEAGCERMIRETVNLSVVRVCELTRISHVFTHFKMKLTIFQCQWQKGRISLQESTAFKWVKIEELPLFPFAKAQLKFMPLIENWGE